MRRKNAPHAQGETREPSLPGRVPFGIARGPGNRIELAFALRQGGVMGVNHELAEPVTAESLDRFCRELREAVAAAAGEDPRTRSSRSISLLSLPPGIRAPASRPRPRPPLYFYRAEMERTGEGREAW